MTNFALRSCLFLLALLSSVTPALCADDSGKTSQTDSLFASAAVANLRAQDSRPFHLRLEIHVTKLSPKPLDVTYDEIWRSPSAWQRRISFPGFMQQEVGDSEGRWLARNVDFRPHAIYLLSRAVGTAMPVSLQPDEQVKKVSDHKKDGVELRCAAFQRKKWQRTLCFMSGGPLVSSDEYNELDDIKLRVDYLDFQKFGEKLYPRQMYVYQNGKQVLEVKVVELAQLPGATQAHFGHAATDRLMALCDRWEETPPIKKVLPEYPPDACRDRQQGKVTLYVALAADGSVDQLKLLESAGTALDNASMQAVKQWVYPPLTCGARPLPSEIEVHVNFSLSVY
jgi:TonB family protein